MNHNQHQVQKSTQASKHQQNNHFPKNTKPKRASTEYKKNHFPNSNLTLNCPSQFRTQTL